MMLEKPQDQGRCCFSLATVLVLATGLLVGCQETGSPSETADAVYVNGRVYTVDESRPWAEAFAIRDGRFQQVGTSEEIERLADADTLRVDLGGSFVMPGLHDAHLHTQMVAEFTANLNVDAALGWSAISEIIRDYAEQNPDKEWILGGKPALAE